MSSGPVLLLSPAWGTRFKFNMGKILWKWSIDVELRQ